MRDRNNLEFFASLKQRGIEISVRGGRLHISAPDGIIDTELRAELTRRKAELIAFLKSDVLASSTHPLLPTTRTGRIPQTQAQQGMWLIDHFDPGHIAYNISTAVVVETGIDRDALQQAVDGVIRRHESLRTSFYEEGGELLQRVSPNAGTQVEFTDLSNFPEVARQETLDASLRQQARFSFDLSRPPLIRFHLFRMAEMRHVLFLNVHHIVSDARSLAILWRDVMELYRAAITQEPAVLPLLPVQYPDYAMWAEKYLTGSSMSTQIEYWKEELAGVPSVLNLPFARRLSGHRTNWGANLTISIPLALYHKLKTIGKEEGATPFITLLATFAVLLYQQTDEEDFCIGSPVTHRRHVETEPLIGLFVNMVALRCRLTGSTSFRELLRNVRDTCLGALENSDVSFQEVVRALKPDLRLQRSPLFQIMFSFEPYQAAEERGVVAIDTNPGTTRFELTLQLHENANGIIGSFEYCTDLFDEPSIAKLAHQFNSLLQQLANQPDAPVASISATPNDAREGGTANNAVSSWGTSLQKLSALFRRGSHVN